MKASQHSGKTTNDAYSPRGVSLDFVNLAMRFASRETRFGLVLRALHFFSRSGTGAAALRSLIEELSPVTLVNLSYQSDWLFSGSKSPAVVLFAGRQSSGRAEITTVQVPWSPAGAQTHTIEIAREDVVTLPLAVWQKTPEFLKAAFFGLRRDLAVLDKLTSNHALLGERLNGLGTKLRAGLIVGNRSQDSRFLHDLPLLTKNDLKPFSVPRDLFSYYDERAQWPRSRDTYRAPLLLIREYLESDGRPVTAVSDRDVVFTNAFFGASLPAGGSEMGLILAAILHSSLASWFFLMTSSTFGLWKRRVLIGDVESLPIPDFETSSHSEASRHLLKIAHELQRRLPEDKDRQELDESVFDLYGLDPADRIVARDGLFRARWQWKTGKRQSAATADIDPHVLAYADAFLKTIDTWLSATKRRRMRGQIFDFPASAPLRVARFVIEEHRGPSVAEVIQPDGSLRDVLLRIGERLDVQLGASLIGHRTLRVYGPDEVVIIKPAARRHWMEVSALEDADAVIADSVSGIIE